MVICLERGSDLHMSQLMPLPLTVSCFSEIQAGFTFLVPARPGSPGKKATKRVCVCVCVCVCVRACVCAHLHQYNPEEQDVGRHAAGTPHLVLDVRVSERLPAELVGLEVDHAAARDGRRRRLLQVGRLEDEVHVRRHLDNLAAHQTQLPAHPHTTQHAR